jgi:hypothetical protein
MQQRTLHLLYGQLVNAVWAVKHALFYRSYTPYVKGRDSQGAGCVHNYLCVVGLWVVCRFSTVL